ncbi:MAG TPA: hypothetical protein ENK99_00775 [Campylobacterales bacterium]|nr:hypothetical protein [Campylobacterales bacterium]
MYDIKPLEEEWKRYQKNKRKPYLWAFIGIILFVFLGFTIFNYKYFSFLKTLTSHEENTQVNNEMKKSSIILDGSISKIQVRKIDKIEHIKPMVKMNINKEETIPTLPVVNDIPILEEKIKPKKQKHTRAIIHTTAQKPRKKMHLNIIESSSVSAYKDVEKRFMLSHDTDDSLFLAKSYYRKGKYKKSEYWSLQTNKVNSDIDESWIIFAKSKIKLGHINEAIQVLKHYVKRSNSKKAKELLYRLKKN